MTIGAVLPNGPGRRTFEVTVSALAATQFALHLALE
ncbi:hypothetical protein SAMN06272789_6462 [Streptomyces sp. 1331.2]|nr:hypothetical protein SAMN06272789_6462 [Streptomyces sp. 1331.2]